MAELPINLLPDDISEWMNKETARGNSRRQHLCVFKVYRAGPCDPVRQKATGCELGIHGLKRLRVCSCVLGLPHVIRRCWSAVPLRLSDEELQTGDDAIHGEEAYALWGRWGEVRVDPWHISVYGAEDFPQDVPKRSYGRIEAGGNLQLYGP
ncbi:hypothetical protein OIU76_006826 [Salix suchowensis]|nr:hypothetical protein OIU76_006826 [Salix suchowensis]